MEINKQAKGLEEYRAKRAIAEIDRDPYDPSDYKSMIKKNCAWCGRVCNPKKSYEYYVQSGNACRPFCKNLKPDKSKPHERINPSGNS
jgi:hypothetical protein